jgi:hypothetical protein
MPSTVASFVVNEVLPDNLIPIMVPEKQFLYGKAYSRVVGGVSKRALRTGCEFARFPPPQNLGTHQIRSSETSTHSKAG